MAGSAPDFDFRGLFVAFAGIGILIGIALSGLFLLLLWVMNHLHWG